MSNDASTSSAGREPKREGQHPAGIFRLSDLQGDSGSPASPRKADTPVASETESRWYVLSEGQQTGPFSAPELVAKARAGELSYDTPVCIADRDVLEWTAAGSFHFIRDVLDGAPEALRTVKMRPVRSEPAAAPASSLHL